MDRIGQQQSRDHHDGSRMADRTYVEPITPEICAKIIAAERPQACCQRWEDRPHSIRRLRWLKMACSKSLALNLSEQSWMP